MCCRVTDLRNKEVINLKDGCRLGFVCDVIVDTCCGKVLAIIVPGRCGFFGFFGRDDDIEIAWENIERIGEDLILVCFEPHHIIKPKKRKFLF